MVPYSAQFPRTNISSDVQVLTTGNIVSVLPYSCTALFDYDTVVGEMYGYEGMLNLCADMVSWVESTLHAYVSRLWVSSGKMSTLLMFLTPLIMMICDSA